MYEACEICGEEAAYWARDTNALGPWVAVCGVQCEDQAMSHVTTCDCDGCKE